MGNSTQLFWQDAWTLFFINSSTILPHFLIWWFLFLQHNLFFFLIIFQLFFKTEISKEKLIDIVFLEWSSVCQIIIPFLTPIWQNISVIRQVPSHRWVNKVTTHFRTLSLDDYFGQVKNYFSVEEGEKVYTMQIRRS